MTMNHHEEATAGIMRVRDVGAPSCLPSRIRGETLAVDLALLVGITDSFVLTPVSMLSLCSLLLCDDVGDRLFVDDGARTALATAIRYIKPPLKHVPQYTFLVVSYFSQNASLVYDRD